MASVHVERLDHLGLIACMITDFGLISMIDARLVPDDQEEITPGEAVAGMILNGLGFANRPLSLTPQFFTNKPLDLLFRPGVRAEMFNRFKLGRTLDEVHAYGCDEVFLTINGERHYLWRAVDQDGNVLAILVQSRRNKKATKKFFRKLLRAESIQSWSTLVPLLPPDKITPNKLTTPSPALVYVCRRRGVKAPCKIL
jgi:Domain of unknown function (DUF4277)/DDE domain